MWGDGDDVVFSLAPSYGYDLAVGSSVTSLEVDAAALPLPPDQYRLTVRGSATSSLHDLSGNRLDGDRNGTEGPDYIRVFEIRANRAPVLDNTGVMRLDAILENDFDNAETLVTAIIASAGGDRITDDPGSQRGSPSWPWMTRTAVGSTPWMAGPSGMRSARPRVRRPGCWPRMPAPASASCPPQASPAAWIPESPSGPGIGPAEAGRRSRCLGQRRCDRLQHGRRDGFPRSCAGVRAAGVGGDRRRRAGLSRTRPATAVTAMLTVSDADSPDLAGTAVQITGNYQDGEDLLSFVNTAGITGNSDRQHGDADAQRHRHGGQLPSGVAGREVPKHERESECRAAGR